MSHSRLIQEPYSPIFSLELDNKYKCLERSFSKIRDLEKDIRRIKRFDGPGIDLKEDALHMERFKLCRQKALTRSKNEPMTGSNDFESSGA